MGAGGHFGAGIISGPIWGSFRGQDHFWSSLGIISGPESFGVQFGDHVRAGDHSGAKFILDPVWGSFRGLYR